MLINLILHNNYSITDITMDSFNYERIFTIKGTIENICKAQAQISEKISQGFEKMSVSIINIGT